MSEYKANESPMCCCVDVGTVIDNSDCSVNFTQIYSEKSEAEDALSYLTSKAKAAESDPCSITSDIVKTESGYQLQANFDFSCQAEAMIFQLSTR
ncbi:YfcZ/YiiS family protein [Otariodibacter oris]|uniref:Uncharacterized protein (TIGR00743 family) n=1 Tax=Otariodibacter oris TaxID=1032623 RepID=A0A420XJJ1_9PAST|nr:YfcZ/YiiS family protein [Otariodibacter oris]QGM80432.1 hypothetical protein A6A10_02975 [Otariodibacter oris]RKR77423.1 uncharacterized protein (TIGR00743 family) [Otariodibacter oris]